MQTKIMNTFKITHENGQAEFLNAENVKQAIANIDETVSPVVALLRTSKNVKTLVADDPTVISFTAVTLNGGASSIATPASGTIHVGDQITLSALPDRNYTFVEWQLDGTKISEEANVLYTVPELEEGVEAVVFTAVFRLSDVAWTSTVSPSEAGTAGCLAFPTEGEIEANGSIDLIAIESEGFTFDHWERNGQSIGTNKILNATVTPLADGETSCVYTAIFTEN